MCAFCIFQKPNPGVSNGFYDPPYENLATVKMEVGESLPTVQPEDSNGVCMASSPSLDLHVGNLTEPRRRLDSTEEMPLDKMEKEECVTVISLADRDCQKLQMHSEHHDGETDLSEYHDREAGNMLNENQLKGEADDICESDTGVVKPVLENLGSHIPLPERNNGFDRSQGVCIDTCSDEQNHRDMPEVAECADQFSFLGIARNPPRNRVRKKSQTRVDFNAKLYRSRCSHRCHKSRPYRAVTHVRQRDGRHQGQGWDGSLLPPASFKPMHKSTCHKHVGETELPNWPLWAPAEKMKPLQWQMIRLEDHLQGQAMQSEDHQLSINESTGCFKICCREGLLGESKTTESIGTRHGPKKSETTRHRWSSGPQVLCHSRQPAVTSTFCAAKSDRGKFMVPKTPRPRRSSPVGRSLPTMPLTTPHKKKMQQTTPAMSALLHSLKNASMYQYSKLN